MMAKQEKSSSWTVGGLVFLGCIIVGAGVGKLAGDVSTYSTIGVGVGFLLMALIVALRRD